jgi:hypothetical protein
LGADQAGKEKIMNRPLYKILASTIDAFHRCEKTGNTEWRENHYRTIQRIQDNYLPSGSGIDSGCQIDVEKSTGEKLVIKSSYHTMNENGYYGRWIDFTVTVKASLQFGLDMQIKGAFGHDQDLKDYLHDVFITDLEKTYGSEFGL